MKLTLKVSSVFIFLLTIQMPVQASQKVTPQSINIAGDVADLLISSHRFPGNFIHGEDALDESLTYSVVEENTRHTSVTKTENNSTTEEIVFSIWKESKASATNPKPAKEDTGHWFIIKLVDGMVNNIEVKCVKCS